MLERCFIGAGAGPPAARSSGMRPLLEFVSSRQFPIGNGRAFGGYCIGVIVYYCFRWRREERVSAAELAGWDGMVVSLLVSFSDYCRG
jgi:hypothetical protein